MPLVMLLAYTRTVRLPPKGQEVTDVFRIIILAIKRNRGKLWTADAWECVKPSTLDREGVVTVNNRPVTWSEKLVEEVRRTMTACSMFLFLPIYFVNLGGVGSLATSQGAALTKKEAPNDLIHNINPLTLLVFVPLLSHGIYPALHRRRIKFGRVNRIVLGFLICALSALVGAIIQWHIYRSNPCRNRATTCDIEPRVSPLSVWAQVPMYALAAISEPL